MKNFTFISAIVLSLQFVNVQADGGGYKCLELHGVIPPPLVNGTPGEPGLYFNPAACTIIAAAKAKYFPDISLQVPYCFTTKLDGTLGDTPVTLIVNSGIIENYNTVNGFDSFNGVHDITAATAITFNKRNPDGAAGKYLGTVYSRDPAIDLPNENDGSNPREYLTIVNGTGIFNQALGALAIEGDAADGPTPVKGRLCFLESHDSHDSHD